MVSERNLDSVTRIPGWVDGDAKIELLLSSSMLVLPSYTEGLPNVILEAMASRLPIITTPVGGIPSALVHNQTAVFVTPGNIREISNAIIALLRNSTRRDHLARAAYVAVCDKYSLEKVSTGLECLYSKN